MNVQIRKTQTKDGRTRYSGVIEVWSNGKRTVVSAGTYDTEREALKAGHKKAALYETDLAKSAALRSKTTLSDFIQEWLDQLEGKLKETTRTEYRRRSVNWIIPTLGHIQLGELSPVHIRRWIDNIKGTKGEPLSQKSKKLALDALKVCLEYAVQDHALTDNPAKNVRIQRSRALQHEEEEQDTRKHWDHEQAATLLKASEGDEMDALVVLCLLGGMRPGEASGLQWKDIDFLTAQVTIRRSNKEATSTKSGKRRTITLPFEGIRRLVAIQEAQVIPSPWVIPHRPDALGYPFKRLCTQAKVQELSPHSLRHTCASLLLSSGMPITAVAAFLGHADPSTTLRYYAWAMPKDVATAPALLERALNVSPQKPTDQPTSDQPATDSNLA